MNYILPALILALLLYALAKGVNIYEAFVKGAADALPMLLYILPYMTAMLAGLTVFRQTGALDRLVGWIAPLFQWIGLPKELVPLFVLRPFSCWGWPRFTPDSGPFPAAPQWRFYRTFIPNMARMGSWAIARR